MIKRYTLRGKYNNRYLSSQCTFIYNFIVFCYIARYNAGICSRNWYRFNIGKAMYHVNVIRLRKYRAITQTPSRINSFFLYFPVTLNKRLFIAWPDNERIARFTSNQRFHCVISYKTFTRQWVLACKSPDLFKLEFSPTKISGKESYCSSQSCYI